jgi:hypothetical protein
MSNTWDLILRERISQADKNIMRIRGRHAPAA